MGNRLGCFKCGVGLNLNLGLNLDKDFQYIVHAERDFDGLKKRVEALRAMKEEVEREIREKNCDPEMEVRNEVETWVDQIGQLEREVSDKANGSFGCGLFSRHSLGAWVYRRMEHAEELKNQRNSWKEGGPIFYKCTAPYIPESLPTDIVGIEETMSQVLEYLKDDKVGFIGIYGMGGAGKTTLIKQVIKRLHSPSEEEPIIKFESIIQVVVSQNPVIQKIQEDIAKELGLSKSKNFEGRDERSRAEFLSAQLSGKKFLLPKGLSESENFKDRDERSRAEFLSAQLSGKKFLLVLDDMWGSIDLKKIGIPHPHEEEEVGNKCGSKCKVVLTTRNEQVCAVMGANKSSVKVGCLRDEDSLELFRKTVGWDADDFESKGLNEIARNIVSKCGGLPLVLITVARAMSTKKTRQEWEDAEKSLEDSPHAIGKMEDVYRLLEFSFNNLKNEEYRSCLRYSALFPEDSRISIAELVDYCIGGGSIGSSSSRPSDINSLRRNGRNIISELIDACLLERTKVMDYVNVHDAIRDMIRWLGGKSNRTGHKILTLAGEDHKGGYDVDDQTWQDASMVSLQWNDITEVNINGNSTTSISSSFCRGKGKISWQNNNLQVLLLHENENLEILPRSLFKYFPKLRVLDLSCTPLEELPESLFMLTSLGYLNLSWTMIEALPKEMRYLTNLMLLDLSYTRKLCKIPSGVFSSLSKLQSMNLYRCAFFEDDASKKKAQRVLKEVDGLRQLKDVGLSFAEDPDAIKFLLDESNTLSKSITKLDINAINLVTHGIFRRIGSELKKLEKLRIKDFLEEDEEEDLLIDEGHFTQLKELGISSTHSLRRIIIHKGRVLDQLTTLSIYSCKRLRDLACLWQLPNLTYLSVWNCDGIEEVLPPQPGGDGDQSRGTNSSRHNPLLKVRSIDLDDMKSLVRISRSPLYLRSLIRLGIYDCPSLKELSIVPSNNSQDVKIWCGKKWWESLKWEDGAPPPNFIPSFQFDSEGEEMEEAAEE